MLGFSSLASTTLADDSKVISEEGGLSLVVNVGSLGLSGQDVTFQAAHSLILDSGVFSLTSRDLLFNRPLTYTTETGDFTLLGQEADLSLNKSLLAETGDFTLSAEDLLVNTLSTLVTSEGAFNLSGQSVGLVTVIPEGVDYPLTAESGSFSVTGQASVFGVTLVGGNSVYTLVGRVANTNTAFSHTEGQFVVEAQDSLLTPAALFTLDGFGSYTSSGQEVELLVNRVLENISYSLLGQELTFSTVSKVGFVDLFLAGQDINISLTPRLSTKAGVFVSSFEDLRFLTDRVVRLDLGTYSLAAVDATLDSNGEIPVVEYDLLLDRGSFTITYKDAVSIDKPSKRRFVNVTGNSENNTSLRNSSNKVILAPFSKVA